MQLIYKLVNDFKDLYPNKKPTVIKIPVKQLGLRQSFVYVRTK